MSFPRRLLCVLTVLVMPLAAAEPSLRPWTEYRTIMWIGDTAYRMPEKLPLFFDRLREMGINAAMVTGDADAQPLLDAKMPFYVENIVNKGLCLKWNSKVRDWDAMVTAWKTGREEAGLVREYSFDDPEWRGWARGRMSSAVRKHAAHQPLAYDIRDELSTTISANPFDYDFSPTALAGFRTWLKTQYRDLAALNAQWDTHFEAWDDVKPFTTDQIKNRLAGGEPDAMGFPRGKPDWQAVQKVRFDPASAAKNLARWNFSPWCDHRTYMDISLARTLDDLRQTARSLDPRTPVGIEGTQMASAFGGYDLWRLSQVLDWVEPYDVGNARDIFGSFMPGKTFLTTVGEANAKAAQRRLWHLLLEGDRGCIIWWSEDCLDWKDENYALTQRARGLAPVLREMQSPLASLFLRAEREVDPVAIHYSHPSIQVNWLLESAEDGSTWLRRFSSYEASHNQLAKRRQAWVKLLQDAGYTPQFVSTEKIERGDLVAHHILVCADSLAMSDEEEAALSKWVNAEAKDRRPPLLLASGLLNQFDGRGRLRLKGGLRAMEQITAPSSETWLFTGKTAADLGEDIGTALNGRGADSTATPLLRKVVARLHEALPPKVVVPAQLAVRTYRHRLGGAQLLAFERNIVWQMGEDLKQSGGNDALEKRIQFEATLPTARHVYDLRSGKYLGLLDRIPVSLDPWLPSIFAATEEKLPEGDPITTLLQLSAR